jgi:hypothetical protein
MAKDSEYGGADGQWGNVQRGAPVRPDLSLRSLIQSDPGPYRLDANGKTIVSKPQYGSSQAAT